MADLFTRGEFASYAQLAEVDNATVDLYLSLVTAVIRAHVGPATYDALSELDLVSLKGVALEAAKRAYLNPSGLRSMQIDDYSETFATETFGGVALTDAEKAAVDAALGRPSSGAFTIRTPAEPFRSPRRRRTWIP